MRQLQQLYWSYHQTTQGPRFHSFLWHVKREHSTPTGIVREYNPQLCFCLSIEWLSPLPQSIHEYYLFPEPIFSNKNGSLHVGSTCLIVGATEPSTNVQIRMTQVSFVSMDSRFLLLRLKYITYVRSYDHRSRKCPHLRNKFNPDKLCENHLRKPLLLFPRTRCCRFISLWTHVDLDLLDLFYKKESF